MTKMNFNGILYLVMYVLKISDRACANIKMDNKFNTQKKNHSIYLALI